MTAALQGDKNVITLTNHGSARPPSGDHRRGETHVPFPNTLVKPSSADGSAATLLCESRSSPVYTKPSFLKKRNEGFLHFKIHQGYQLKGQNRQSVSEKRLRELNYSAGTLIVEQRSYAGFGFQFVSEGRARADSVSAGAPCAEDSAGATF